MMIRRALCLVLALLLCLGVSMAEEAEDLITAEDLQSRIATHLSLNLFDVRAEDAFAAGHIPTALSFPLEQLKDALQSILNGGYSYMDTEIVVYGATEEQSASAAEIVRGLGFTNVSRFPSLAAWTGRWLTAACRRASRSAVTGQRISSVPYHCPFSSRRIPILQVRSPDTSSRQAHPRLLPSLSIPTASARVATGPSAPSSFSRVSIMPMAFLLPSG